MGIHATDYYEKMARISLTALGVIEAEIADIRTALENMVEEEKTVTVLLSEEDTPRPTFPAKFHLGKERK